MFLVLGYRQLLGHSNCWFEQLSFTNLRGWCQFLLLVQNMGRTGESASRFIVCYFLAIFRSLDYRWYLVDTRLSFFVAERERRMRSWGVNGVNGIIFLKHEVNTHLRNRFTRGSYLGLPSSIHARIEVFHVSWTRIRITLKLKRVIQEGLIALFPWIICPHRRTLPMVINNGRMRLKLQIVKNHIVDGHLIRLLLFLFYRGIINLVDRSHSPALPNSTLSFAHSFSIRWRIRG